MEAILSVLLIADSLLVIAAVLVQQPGEGGLSASLAASSFQTTRRGSDKFLHEATVFLSILFVALAVALLLIR